MDKYYKIFKLLETSTLSDNLRDKEEASRELSKLYYESEINKEKKTKGEYKHG